MRTRQRVLAVASTGGHWAQLMQIAPAFGDQGVCFVQTTGEGRYANASYQVSDCNQTTPLKAVLCLCQLVVLMIRLHPKVVVSTGALPGVLALLVARVVGAQTLWVDSVANVDRLSMSGRLALKVAHLHLCQWPQLAQRAGSQYAGSVL